MFWGERGKWGNLMGEVRRIWGCEYRSEALIKLGRAIMIVYLFHLK